MSNRIAVVGEAAGDFEVARELIDQTILRCVEYADDSVIDTLCEYVGPSVNQPFVVWKSLDTSDPKDYRLAVRGRFGLSDPWPNNDVAIRVRRAIFDCLSRASDAFVVIVKDTDNDDTRRAELRQVAPLIEKMPVILGVQHTEQECWLLAGFQAKGEEQRRLDELCGKWPPGVGFNPCDNSHDLTATKKDHEKLSPKRVLNHLSGGDRARELEGLHRDHHAILKARGVGNGLAAFLRDIEQRLIWTVFAVRVVDS